MKTPQQVANDVIAEHSRVVTSKLQHDSLAEWIRLGIEADRAQRQQVIDRGWADDAADYGSCDQVEVEVTGLSESVDGYRTVMYYTDFKLTGGQAYGMFAGIAASEEVK